MTGIQQQQESPSRQQQLSTPSTSKRVVTQPPTRTPAKRIKEFDFKEKSSTFMGFETFFLREHARITLEYTTRLVKVKSTRIDDVRFMVTHIKATDKGLIQKKLNSIVSVFPTTYKTPVKNIFTSDNNNIFAKGSTNLKCYNRVRERIQLGDIAQSSTCKVSFIIIGIKVKDNEPSFMLALDQIQRWDEEDSDDECVFPQDENDTDDA